MNRSAVDTAKTPAAIGPFSKAVRIGDFLFVSGQLPADPASGAFPDSIEDQTRVSLGNLAAVLEAGGASLASVAKTTVYLKDMNDFARMNAVYAEHFPDAPPARSTVEVARLPGDAKVEIEAIALASGPLKS
ncbi:RidA family protein [Hansschlegelia quercus]|uniref:Deaminase n=1 Tax=Hansschlegelia quercus TaxID=2528245 RepID=A0A4Q9GHA6_9HYPH|nr:Rid family detoxifying hydrolase [Hansschlegelia quercus]TBN53549.1 deaminase [Hansschlegelia quercus]